MHNPILDVQCKRLETERDDCIKTKLQLRAEIRARKKLFSVVAISQYAKIYRLRKKMASSLSELAVITCERPILVACCA